MSANRRPTIIDVARKAGVSKSTVSLVLRNSPAVREATRQRVRAAMADVGYFYNRAAATLRAPKAGLVGVVINDLRNPFFAEFAISLQMSLSARGFLAIVANTDEDPEMQDRVVSSMIEHGVSALILCPAYGEVARTFDTIARAGIPAMQMLRRVDDRLDLFPFAAPDYRAASRAATAHLRNAGAQRIAFVGGIAGRAVTEERLAGYMEAVRSSDLPPLFLPGRARRAFGRTAALTLVAEHPDVDAAVCFNDLVALGMLSGLSKANRRIGDDFRLVGFDDIEEMEQAVPPLSSVHCDIAGFGVRAAETLLDWLEKGVQPPQELRTAVSLAIRASSGLPSGGAGIASGMDDHFPGV